MIASQIMNRIPILCVVGPTASGKTARAISEAKARNGEIVSVDSRQVYRMLNIGTEKATMEDRCNIPHYLIDICDAQESYSAGDFVADATKYIEDIYTRGKLPILVGGTLFYFDALLHGLPEAVPSNPALRAQLDTLSDKELYAQVLMADPQRAKVLDPKNRRRLIRALEIINAIGTVPKRVSQKNIHYIPEWIVQEVPKEELRTRIDIRLKSAFERGLIEEVRQVRDHVGDRRLNELGL